tara:strand:- start:64 stop:258 length:195 start_codon:yes stop_codon:yes gene_type:complete
MEVRITNLPQVNSDDELVEYTVTKASECRDSLDRMAYELAVEHMNIVTIGCVIAEPIMGDQHGR